jgi:hypothetical protein
MKQSKAEIQKLEDSQDDAEALGQLAQLLGKRHGKKVSLTVTRHADGSGEVAVGMSEPYVEPTLRHAVNSALAGELLK